MCCYFDWDRIRGKLPPLDTQNIGVICSFGCVRVKEVSAIIQPEQMGRTAEEQSAVHGEERLACWRRLVVNYGTESQLCWRLKKLLYPPFKVRDMIKIVLGLISNAGRFIFSSICGNALRSHWGCWCRRILCGSGERPSWGETTTLDSWSSTRRTGTDSEGQTELQEEQTVRITCLITGL